MKKHTIIKQILPLNNDDFESNLIEDTFIEYGAVKGKKRNAIFQCIKCNAVYQNEVSQEKQKEKGHCSECLLKEHSAKIVALNQIDYPCVILFDSWFKRGRDNEEERTAIFKCNKCSIEYFGNAYDESYESDIAKGCCHDCSSLKPLIKEDYKAKLIKDLGYYYNKLDSHRYAEFKCNQCTKSFIKKTLYMKKHQRILCDKCYSLFQYNEKSRLFRIWNSMKARTSPKIKENSHYWRSYGSKQITLCSEWNDFKIFESWALSSGYNDLLKIDRIDNDGNYEPENCRWTSSLVQSRNTRRLQKRNTSGYRGVTKTTNKEKWRAQISVNYKRIQIGTFNEKEEAALAYDAYINKYNLEHTKNF